MPGTHLLELNDFSPPQLCAYIERRYYRTIEVLIKNLNDELNNLASREEKSEIVSLQMLLFQRMKAKVEQLIREDRLVIFPLIIEGLSDKVNHPGLPLKMILKQHTQIVSMLEKLRDLANNYRVKPAWGFADKFLYEEMYSLERLVTHAIHLKENVLFQKLA